MLGLPLTVFAGTLFNIALITPSFVMLMPEEIYGFASPPPGSHIAEFTSNTPTPPSLICNWPSGLYSSCMGLTSITNSYFAKSDLMGSLNENPERQ